MAARVWIVALLVGVAACSGGEASPTMPDPSSPTTSGPVEAAAAITAFRECLAQHGVEAPEITTSGAGSLQLSELAAADLARQPSLLGLCGAPVVDAGLLDLTSRPELAAAVLADLQAFAECMRSHGIEGFPDPVPGFTGIGDAFDRDEVPFGLDGYADAFNACSEAMPASAG
ncbi:MAG TPA: hypothetical protein VID03_11165 [Acidimicrobiia bacterium]|jgi:hypothetical protein